MCGIYSGVRRGEGILGGTDGKAKLHGFAQAEISQKKCIQAGTSGFGIQGISVCNIMDQHLRECGFENILTCLAYQKEIAIDDK